MENAKEFFKELHKTYPNIMENIVSTKEQILSNIAMISQIPAKTFEEEDRANFILERFMQYDFLEPATDELQNVYASWSSKNKKAKKILIFANMDSEFETSYDSNIIIKENCVEGLCIATDVLALATLVTLPEIINRIGLKLNYNITFLSTTRSHGKGDYKGIRYFLKKHKKEFHTAIQLNGLSLGKIDYTTLSRIRGDIICRTKKSASRDASKTTSAIMALNEIMSEIFEIPIPARPKTTLNIGMISGGVGYKSISREAALHFEVLSEDDEITDKLIQDIQSRAMDVSVKHSTDTQVNFFGRHHAYSVSSASPLVRTAINIIKYLKYQPEVAFYNSELSVPLSYEIPSLGIGLTTGRYSTNKENELIQLEPLPQGILQLIALLTAIEKGCCDGK